MKKLMFLMLLPMLCSSQIQVREDSYKTKKIGEVKQMGAFIAELEYEYTDRDSFCVLRYKNAKYTHITDIQSIRFTDTDDTVFKLYQLMKSAFSDENKKNKDFKIELNLGAEAVLIGNIRMMGITNVSFYTSGGHFYLGESQLEKLFGR